MRRLLPLIIVAVAVFAPAAHASTKRALVGDVQLYKAKNGALVVTARADLTGHLRDVRRFGDAAARLTIRLSDGTHVVRGSDRLTVGRAHHLGTPARFRIEIPPRRARAFNTGRKMTWTARLERSPKRARRSTRQGFSGIPSLCGLMTLTSAQTRQGCGPQPLPPQPAPPPPPAPPVGFSTLINTDAYGNYQSLQLCAYFGGSGYAKPFIGFLEFNDSIPDANNAATVSSDGDGEQAYPIAADGSFSFGGTYAWVYGGPTAAVTITGNVPSAILSSPATAATDNASATYTPAQQYVAAPFSAAYDAALPQQVSPLC